MLLCTLYESEWLSQFDKEYFEPVELHVSEKNLDEISNEELNFSFNTRLLQQWVT